MRLFLILLFVLGFAVPGGVAAAQPDKYVKIRLLPERSHVQPGETIRIGIEQSIYPGWHTYWVNPGDSGARPRVEWDLPDGFKAGEIQWPVPRKLPYGPLLNYGYEEHVILLQDLKIPEDLPAGPVILSADIEVLVCADICIPEFGTYSLTFNDPAAAEDNSAYLNRARGKLPAPYTGKSTFAEEGGSLVLILEGSEPVLQGPFVNDSVAFIPLEWGVIDNPAEPEVTFADDRLTIRQKRGERPLDTLETISGLVIYENREGERRGTFFTATRKSAKQAGAFPDTAQSPEKNTSSSAARTGFVSALMLALLGGLILNLMPCVFPVLSLKTLSLVKISAKDESLARRHGLAYTAGVLLSFGLIAALLIALKAAGAEIGWGFQLQNPVLVGLLAYLLFIVGLNLSGLFEIPGGAANIGRKLTKGTGLHQSFFTGILATLVATPCTAPFMGVAMGYALVQPALPALSVFLALGLGLALPYLLLSFIPAFRKALPKPGPWMETFRQLLAFPMFASAAWLAWVLAQQAGHIGVLGILMGAVLIAFGFWLWRRRPEKPEARRALHILAIMAFIGALALLPAGMAGQKAASHALQAGSFGEEFTPAELSRALENGAPVFVEMTAAWCITCKVNHALAINTAATKTLFAERGVRYLVGDWTNYDPGITHYLNSFERSGVPLYVYYGPKDPVTGKRPEPQVLPQLLTPAIVAEAVKGIYPL